MSDLHCPNCGTELDLATAFCAETDRKALERLVEAAGPQMVEPDLALEFARTVIQKARGEA